MRFLQNALQKRLWPQFHQPALGVVKLFRADAFGTFRSDDQGAARCKDINRTDHALDRLIIGFIQRIARRTGEDGFEAARDRDFSIGAHEFNGLQMTAEDFTKIDKRQLPFFVNNRIQGQCAAEHADDFQLLFVQWIAVEITVGRVGIGHEAGAVKRGDGFGVCQAGCDDFAPAGITRHEVRFDQTGGDLDISLDKTLVQPHYCAAGGGLPQMHVVLVVTGKMILDPHGIEHPGIAYQFSQFVAFIGAVQSGGDQYHDIFCLQAGTQQGLNERAQKQMIRYRSGDITNGDTSAVLAARQFGQRRTVYRRRQCLLYGSCGIVQQRHSWFANDAEIEVIG